MKLLGKDIDAEKVLSTVKERLELRGLSAMRSQVPEGDAVEPRVEPLSFNLDALSENADSTQGLPLETHRAGVSGRLVVGFKRLFRQAGQGLINELLGRQVVFNGHVRDSYAQLSAELMRLRARMGELEADLQAQARFQAPAPPRAATKRTAKKPRRE